MIASLALSLSMFAAVLSPAEAAKLCADHAETLPAAKAVRYLQLTGPTKRQTPSKSSR